MAYSLPSNDTIGLNRLLVGDISTGALTLVVSDVTGLNANGGYLTVDPGVSGKQEVMHYSGFVELTKEVTIDVRGITITDGVYATSSGVTHSDGAKVIISDNAVELYAILNEDLTFAGDKTFSGEVTISDLVLDTDWTAAGATCANLGTVSAATSITTSALVATTADINGGTIDGTVIGGSTPAAGSFTTLSATGLVKATKTAVTGPEYRLVNLHATSHNSSFKFTKGLETTDVIWQFACDPDANGADRLVITTGDGGTYAEKLSIDKTTGVFDLKTANAYFSRAGTPITQKVGVSYIQYSGGDGAWEYNTGLTSVEGIMVLAVDDAANSGSDGWAKSTTNEYCITDQVAFNVGKLVEVGADCAVTAWNATGGRFSVTWANATGRTIDMMIHYWGY